MRKTSAKEQSVYFEDTGSTEFVSTGQIASPRFIDLASLNTQLSQTLLVTHTMEYMAKASAEAGNVVKIDLQNGGIPFLVGNDNRPIQLYRIIEEIDEITDFDTLKVEFPTLSYTQLIGALAFLRKLSQINIQGIGIDTVEDAEIESSPEFQAIILNSLADQEAKRVLTVE